MWLDLHRAGSGIQGHPQSKVQSHLELCETLYPKKGEKNPSMTNEIQEDAHKKKQIKKMMQI